MKTYFWREFRTQTAVKDAIRSIVDPQPFKTPFESALISDLIAERHYFCSLRGLRPSRFWKLPGYGPKRYKFQGDFAEQPTPTPIGWHTVSWDKCVRPPWTNWDRIVRAMRDRIQPEKTRYKDEHPICEMCVDRPTEEAHHANPPFLTIAKLVRERVSEAEMEDCLGEWNWFLPANFALPAAHKITLIFDELHSTARLQALCRECHNTTKRQQIE